MGLRLREDALNGIKREQYQVSKSLTESTQRLNSGYRINSAADDPAGLAVSQKMRSIDKGLRQGMRNVSDGINYMDTVDGAEQTLHDMLHRMKALAVESANGTNSKLERKALDLEYQQLNDEIYEITGSAEFNTIPLFDRHQPEYGKREGSVVHNEPIVINRANDQIVFGYKQNGKAQTCVIDIPHGTYEADELADMIDTDLFEKAPDLIIGVNEENQFTIQCENGSLDYIDGRGITLFYNYKIGSDAGYLLGVTEFPVEHPDWGIPVRSELADISGIDAAHKGCYNNKLNFRIGNTDDTVYTIQLSTRENETDNGLKNYTISELVDEINLRLNEIGLGDRVTAVERYSDDTYTRKVIGLKCPESITGLSGNFLKIDEISSPLYDIRCHNEVINTKAVLQGKVRLDDNINIERGRNNYFVLDVKYYVPRADEQQAQAKIRVDLLDDDEIQKKYTMAQLRDRIADQVKQQFDALGIPKEYYPITTNITTTEDKKDANVILMESSQFGKMCEITLDETDVPSGYMIYDLFDRGTISEVKPVVPQSYYRAASFSAHQRLGSAVRISNRNNTIAFDVQIKDNTGDTSKSNISHRFSFTLPTDASDPSAMKSYTPQQIITELNKQLKEQLNSYIPQLRTSYPDRFSANEPINLGLEFSLSSDNCIVLTSSGTSGANVSSITEVRGMSGYDTLIQGYYAINNVNITSGSEDPYETRAPMDEYGRPTVTNVPGSTGQGGYSAGNNTMRDRIDGNYIDYDIRSDGTYVAPKVDYKEGETKINGIEGLAGPDDLQVTSPEMTISGILTQFGIEGGSIDNMSLGFTFKYANKEQKFDISIPAGTSKSGVIDIINTTLKDSGLVASAKGDDLFLTVADDAPKNMKGFGTSFENVYGTMLKTVNKVNGDYIITDRANNKAVKPATLNLGSVSGHLPFDVSAGNKIVLDLGTSGVVNITIPPNSSNGGKYNTVQSLVDAIKTQLGSDTRVKAEVIGNSIVFTGDVNVPQIKYSDESTCPLDKTKQMPGYIPPGSFKDTANNTVYSPPTLTIRGSAISSNVTPELVIDKGRNENVTFTYSTPSGNRNISLSLLRDGETTADIRSIYDIRDRLNEAFSKYDINIGGTDKKLSDELTVKIESGNLVITTKYGTNTKDGKGRGYSITNFNSQSGFEKYDKKAPLVLNYGTATPDYPNNQLKRPATLSNDQLGTWFSSNSATVYVDESNNKISLTINGNRYEATIPTGDYTYSALEKFFEDEIITKQGAPIEITQNSRYLFAFATKTKGSGSIQVNSSDTCVLFDRREESTGPSSNVINDLRCRMFGRRKISSSNPVDLTGLDNNKAPFKKLNEMTFDYTDKDGNVTTFTASAKAKEYTDPNELARDIQESLDKQSAYHFKVSVDSSGRLQIYDKNPGSYNSIGNFQGGLFDRAFQDPGFYNKVETHLEKGGTSEGDTVSYIAGRNPLEPTTDEEIESGKNVIIKKELHNDSLTFDFTIQGSKHKISLTIPEGEYYPEELASVIQEVGREEIEKLNLVDDQGYPLPADLFHATIGLDKLGLDPNKHPNYGLNDHYKNELVLSYVMPKDGSIEENEVIIDGVCGTSAYRVFYLATDLPRPSRITGKADISNGVVIQSGINDTFTVTVDGNDETIVIPAGCYAGDDLVNTMNSFYEKNNSNIRAINNHGHLTLVSAENGEFPINKVRGNAADTIFYGGEYRENDDDIDIHTGRRTDSYITLLMSRVDNHLMRINTTGISTVERALKAINRLDYANKYLSSWRAVAGAQKNRAEFAFQRNQLITENLEASESSIRDTDMPAEIRNYAKQQLLQQVQGYMQKQDQENRGSIMNIMG